jgi:ribosomal protein S18 acetylase RimI-like enzyme
MNNKQLLYKKIIPKDYGKLLYEMDTKASNRTFDYPSLSIEMTLNYLKNCEVYLAYDGDTVIGSFAFEVINDQVEIKQLIVVPEYQNKGYGDKIAKELLRINDGKKVWLVTHPQNTVAIILYLKNNFEIAGWKDNYYGNGQPRLILISKSKSHNAKVG